MNNNFIIKSFWANGANCVCVAYIKALIIKHGLYAGVTLSKSKKYIRVTLSNAEVLTFLHKDVSEVNRGNKISFRRYKKPSDHSRCEKLKFTVRLLFAILVRNLQLNKYESQELSRPEAVNLLARKGVRTNFFHKLLGVKRTPAQKLSTKSLSMLARKKAVLLYNKKHVVVCSSGYYDDYGEPCLIGDRIPFFFGEKASAWFELK
jgi:hypothetical protein